jgi:hypothetical protein
MRIAVGLLSLSLVGACTDAPSLSEVGSAITTHNKLAGNKLAGNKLELNMAGAGDLMETPDGREVLTYIVSCALPEGQTLVGENAGVTYEFFGELGLTPKWTDQPLKKQGRGWISACLFARVNLYDVALPVSLRGPNPALAVTADERATWSVEEGAFYGEFFTPDDQPINWIACRGEGQASGEFGELVSRDCAEPDPADPTRTLCGFHYAGDCGDFAADPACRVYSEHGTYYKNCGGAIAPVADDDDDDDDSCDHGGSHRRYRQVITTFVTPT